MTFGELLCEMRSRLVPGGTAPLVRLSLRTAYVDEALVTSAIDELERAALRNLADNRELNALERLGVQLLMDSIDQ